MTACDRRDDAAWDAFFDFIAEEAVEMNEDDIRAELRSHRINVEPAVDRIKHAVQAAQARQAMDKAPAQRTRLLRRLRELTVQPLEDARRDLRGFLQTLGTEKVHQLYYNRLDSAASDDDIQSLVEDLAALELFEDEPADGPQKKT